MDPSERLFLEESWKAIEDAGADPRGLSRNRWGVFCGGAGDYTLRLKEVLGTSPHLTASTIPGRVSYCSIFSGHPLWSMSDAHLLWSQSLGLLRQPDPGAV